MIKQVDRDEVQRLLTTRRGQLVEVLPRQAYDEEHIRGALSIPLKELGDHALARLRRDLPVIVYCYDSL